MFIRYDKLTNKLFNSSRFDITAKENGPISLTTLRDSKIHYLHSRHILAYIAMICLTNNRVYYNCVISYFYLSLGVKSFYIASMTRLTILFKSPTSYLVAIGWIISLSTSFLTPIDQEKQSLVAQTTNRDTVVIESRASWEAKEAKSFKQHVPTQITVHHEGGKVLTPMDDARQRLRNIQSWCMGPDRNWADIPYHLLIGPDGTVYQGRDPLTAGETNTDYDPTGHLLISFLGNYSQQKLDEKQLQVLIDLLVDSCIKYNIDPNQISTHRDHSDQTTCPGEDIYSYFKSGYIVDQVRQSLQHTTVDK